MIHDRAAEGFGAQADAYARARPTYHPALIARLVEHFVDRTADRTAGRTADRTAGGGAVDRTAERTADAGLAAAGREAVVVELGAGTGILTRQLVDAGLSPIAIEPVDAMRARLIADCPTAEVHAGTAEATGLTARCADIVVVGQAFHWFDHAAALDEIARITRTGGILVCVWNVRDETVPWVAGFTALVDRHAGDTPRHRTMDWRRAIDADPRYVAADDWAIANPSRQRSLAWWSGPDPPASSQRWTRPPRRRWWPTSMRSSSPSGRNSTSRIAASCRPGNWSAADRHRRPGPGARGPYRLSWAPHELRARSCSTS